MFRRIKNLWKLSEYSPATPEQDKFGANPPGTRFAMITKPPEFKPATIVDMSPPVDLEEELNKNNNVS